MNWIYNDGGRAQAGFKGKANDCVTRSISIITGKPYPEVYKEINLMCELERRQANKRSSARTGIFKSTSHAYLIYLGFTWTPTMKIGQGCCIHLKADELPSGRLLVQVSKHLTAVIDGTIHDTFNPSRNETRCVYGYWQKKI